ncbi:MAG TPA: hypothetical protein PK402_03245, partial [Tepidisphaeraceae bacterium]|nr:hypothetical protein [Tepidisphaeraceae bacterium]
NVTSIHQFSEINNTFNNSGIFAKTGASDFAFEGAVSFLNSGTVNLNGGTVTTGAPITGGGIMNINAATSVLIAPALDQGALQVNGGLKLTGNDHRTTVTSLVMGANSYVELGNNGLAVNYNGASPLVGLTAKLIAGRNGGAWDGVGIRSSAAAADNTTAIGFGEASHTGLNTFMGSGIDQTAVLFRHTLLGDANLDHAVNFPDLLTVAKNFGQTGLIWTRGNFNFDGSGNVDFADLLVIAQRYGNSLPTFSTLARHNGRASIGLQVLN